MEEAVSKYDLSDRDLARGRNLKIAAWLAPILPTAIPAVVFTVLVVIFGTTPPVAFTLFVFGAVLTAVGLVAGLALMTFFLLRRSNWTREMREKIAADGIRAEEIDWFMHEVRSNEKRALRDISRSDLLLADAYRETLASRLTATRIVKSSKKELAMTKRRQAKLRQFHSDRAVDFGLQLEKDAEKIRSIHEDAKLMLAEAEARLQMIEAASARGRGMADSELALKKLSSRSQNLPLALEEMRRTEELAREIELDLEKDEEQTPELSTGSSKEPAQDR